MNAAAGSALVLVVDDDEDIRTLIGLRLRRRGYRVAEARDGAEALEAVAAERPGVLVLDAMMPRVDGHEVIRRLRADAATRELGVILLSARAAGADADAGLDAGADVYLAKPFRAEALLDAVEQLLSQSRR